MILPWHLTLFASTMRERDGYVIRCAHCQTEFESTWHWHFPG
jgi:hypothetical protein